MKLTLFVVSIVGLCGTCYATPSYYGLPPSNQGYYPPVYPGPYDPYPVPIDRYRGTTVITETETPDYINRFLWGNKATVKRKVIQQLPNNYWGVPDRYPQPVYVPPVYNYPYLP